jgi:membrane peptidoglycan carboxypeptidase
VDQDLIARARLDAQGRLAVHTPEGEAPLTLDPKLQEELTKLLDRFDTPYGAVVVMEPSTGKVLAMAEHSGAEPQMRGLPTKAIFPAASVFKLVTASALLEKGVSPLPHPDPGARPQRQRGVRQADPPRSDRARSARHRRAARVQPDPALPHPHRYVARRGP